MQLRTYQPGDPATFTFTGKQLDQDGGLDWYYFGARFYDAEVGRFLGVDPLAGKYPALNPYHYTMNNPLIYVDPDGKDFIGVSIDGITAAGYGGVIGGITIGYNTGSKSVVIEAHGGFGYSGYSTPSLGATASIMYSPGDLSEGTFLSGIGMVGEGVIAMGKMSVPIEGRAISNGSSTYNTLISNGSKRFSAGLGIGGGISASATLEKSKILIGKSEQAKYSSVDLGNQTGQTPADATNVRYDLSKEQIESLSLEAKKEDQQ